VGSDNCVDRTQTQIGSHQRDRMTALRRRDLNLDNRPNHPPANRFQSGGVARQIEVVFADSHQFGINQCRQLVKLINQAGWWGEG
jgi:hypothetical protein